MPYPRHRPLSACAEESDKDEGSSDADKDEDRGPVDFGPDALSRANPIGRKRTDE